LAALFLVHPRYIQLNDFMPWLSKRKRAECKRTYGMKNVQQLRAEMSEGQQGGAGKKALESQVAKMLVDPKLDKETEEKVNYTVRIVGPKE
jgi:hypothetical protein